MAREFIVDGRQFPDPDPGLSVDEVRQHFATFFPELSNSDTKGPAKQGVDDVYTFTRRTGTKG